MFWLRNKKIKFSLITLNLSPDSIAITFSAVEDQHKDLTSFLCIVLNTVNSEISREFLGIALKDIHVFVVLEISD